MIFKWDGKEYNNEQEIIDDGVHVIYRYCRNVKGRWRDIEHLMIADDVWGYYYAWVVIKGRYEPELETLYLMKHSGKNYVKWYSEQLIPDTE